MSPEEIRNVQRVLLISARRARSRAVMSHDGYSAGINRGVSIGCRYAASILRTQLKLMELSVPYR